MMGLYEKYLLPKLINLVMKSPDFYKLRQQLIPMASGKVIEIGIGSGLNLPFYSPDVQVTGVDPSLELQEYAVEVARESNMAVDFIARGCEEIPVPDNQFDTAVITWTLCSVPDPSLALAEVRRVLKPEGRLIFSEHGLSPHAPVARWQKRINPVWRKIGGGCNLDRKTDELIEQNGFKFSDLTEGYVGSPKFATYTYRGTARLA